MRIGYSHPIPFSLIVIVIENIEYELTNFIIINSNDIQLVSLK